MQDKLPSTTAIQEDVLLDIREVCEFWGGTRSPLNISTIYRQINHGEHPKPIKIGGLTRFSLKELKAELAKRMSARDGSKSEAA